MYLEEEAAAARAGCTTRTLRNWRAKGLLRHMRRSSIYYSAEDLDRCIAARETKHDHS